MQKFNITSESIRGSVLNLAILVDDKELPKKLKAQSQIETNDYWVQTWKTIPRNNYEVVPRNQEMYSIFADKARKLNESL